MKKILLLLGSIFIFTSQYAQTSEEGLGFNKSGITISTGLNNNVGIIGGSFYYAPTASMVLEAGLGMGSWGYKSSFNGQFYIKPEKKTYFKVAFCHSTGVESVLIKLESTTLQQVEYTLKLKPANNLNITYGRSWAIKQKNRFYFEAGYSKILADKSTLYSVTSKPVGAADMSNLSKKSMEITIPSGIILAIGFSIGI